MPVTRPDRRPLGVVYTPPEVARPMVHLALGPLVATASSAELLALRICDPAMGAGAFLVEVVTYLADHLVAAWRREGRIPTGALADRPDAPVRREARRHVIEHCIFGIDVDADAIARATETLRELGGADPARPPGTARDAATAFVVGDALALDARAAFPEVLARGGFDVVLANPPYIRQERLGRKASLASYAVYDGVADLYVYFVELAHRLLRPRGRYCLIVPTKWMTAAYGAPLRAFLADARSVDGIVDLARHALFADADAFPCIVWGTARAREDRAPPRIATARAAPGRALDEVLDGAARAGGDAGDDQPSCDDRPAIARARWTAEPWHIAGRSDGALLDRLERRHPTLGELIKTRWSRGVVTGLNQAFVVDRSVRDAMIAADAACAPYVRRFLKGRDVRPYVPADAERWLLLIDRGTAFAALPPPIREHLARFRARLEPRPAGVSGAWAGRKPGAYAWHELQDPVVPLAKSRAPRLLYQDIQTAPACCFDPAGELVPDTTVWILPSDDRYLLAILCSSLYGWYARHRFPPALNGAVRPKLAYMQRLPIPTPSPDLRSAIEQAVDRRMASAHAGPDRARLDAELGRLVAAAYELSAQDIALTSR